MFVRGKQLLQRAVQVEHMENTRPDKLRSLRALFVLVLLSIPVPEAYH